MAGMRAFLTGLRRALAYWQVLLALLLGSLLAAGALALLPGLSLYPLSARPLMGEIAAGVQPRHVVDLFGSLLQTQSPVLRSEPPSAPPAALVMGLVSLLFSLLLLPLAGGVVSAFLYGGALVTYRQAPEPFGWGRFFAACWRWFSAYLLLALIQAVLFALLVLPAAALLFVLLRGVGVWGAWLALALALALLLVWLALFELARVQMVAHDTRSPFSGLGLAFARLFRSPAALLGFYALALAGLLLVHLVFRLGLLPFVPLGLLPLALLVQQAFILARLAARAARLAGLMALEPSPAAPPVEIPQYTGE